MIELELTGTPGDRRLYMLAGIGTLRLAGKRLVTVQVADRFDVDAGLLLFGAFVVRGLAEDANAAASAASTAPV